MPRLEDGQEFLLQAEEAVTGRVKRAWHGFSEFALQDNVLEVAVGLIIAAAFTTVVTSFVSDILLPPLSLIGANNRNLDEKFAVLKRGAHYVKGHGYNTTLQAVEDGAVILSYGAFLNKLLNFAGVGLALYLIANIYGWVSRDSILKDTVKCKYCRKRISSSAKRCVNCTSWQDGREDRMH